MPGRVSGAIGAAIFTPIFSRFPRSRFPRLAGRRRSHYNESTCRWTTSPERPFLPGDLEKQRFTPYRYKERLLMKLSITAAAILLIGTSTMANADDNVQVVADLPTASSGGLYTANRARWRPAR